MEEARAWRTWLLRAIAGRPAETQIMYGLAGERRLTETILDWLPGYEGAKPVRIGNAASQQFQLDVYGEVLDVMYHARLSGLEAYADRLAEWPRPGRIRRISVATARRGYLGGARSAPAFHPLQGDGLGRSGPRHQGDASASASRGRSSVGVASATPSTPRYATRVSIAG